MVLAVLVPIVALFAGESFVRVVVGPPAAFLFSGPFRDRQTDWDVDYGIGPDGRRATCGATGAGAVRFAVLGDSFAFGQGVADCRDFVSQAAAMLPALRFQNFGLIGAGVGEYRMVARDRLHPETGGVFVLFYGNDISEIPRARSLAGDLADRMAMFSLFRKLRRGYLVAQEVEGGSAATGEPPNNIRALLRQDPRYFQRVVQPEPERMALFAQAFAGLMGVLKSSVGENGIYVAMAPEGTVVSTTLRGFVERHGGAVAEFGQPGEAYALVRSLAGKHGVRFVENFEAFQRDGESNYFPHDLHWTPAGHATMARLLHDALAADRHATATTDSTH